MKSWNRPLQAALLALEADAVSARGGFACLFSTAEEYEAALITQRRALGYYERRRSIWPVIAFVVCTTSVVGAVLLAR